MSNAPILIPISTLYRIDSIAFIVLFALLSISSEEGVGAEVILGVGVGVEASRGSRSVASGLGVGVTVGNVFVFISSSRASVERGVGSDSIRFSSSITTTVASTSGMSCTVTHPTMSIVRTATETTIK